MHKPKIELIAHEDVCIGHQMGFIGLLRGELECILVKIHGLITFVQVIQRLEIAFKMFWTQLKDQKVYIKKEIGFTVSDTAKKEENLLCSYTVYMVGQGV